MRKPLISVVLPLYNRQEYIKESINSVLEQTITDLELLIIDDASTDGSLEIIKRIKDPRIKLFTKTINEGVASAINIGLQQAKGEFVARMDSDDISYPERFEKQLKVFQDNPNLVVCGSWVVRDDDVVLKFRETHEEILVNMLHRCALSMGTSFFKRKKMDGLFLKEGLRHGEDYEFWSRLILKGEFYNIQEPLLYYRSNSSQLSQLYEEKQRIMDVDIQLTFLKRIPYNQNDYPDSLLKNILKRETYFSPSEFKRFLNWQKHLIVLNEKTGCFLKKEFNQFIEEQRRNLIFDLFFKRNNINQGKNWRIKVFLNLNRKEQKIILNQKLKEKAKLMWNG